MGIDFTFLRRVANPFQINNKQKLSDQHSKNPFPASRILPVMKVSDFAVMVIARVTEIDNRSSSNRRRTIGNKKRARYKKMVHNVVKIVLNVVNTP